MLSAAGWPAALPRSDTLWQALQDPDACPEAWRSTQASACFVATQLVWTPTWQLPHVVCLVPTVKYPRNPFTLSGGGLNGSRVLKTIFSFVQAPRARTPIATTNHREVISRSLRYPWNWQTS